MTVPGSANDAIVKMTTPRPITQYALIRRIGWTRELGSSGSTWW